MKYTVSICIVMLGSLAVAAQEPPPPPPPQEARVPIPPVAPPLPAKLSGSAVFLPAKPPAPPLPPRSKEVVAPPRRPALPGKPGALPAPENTLTTEPGTPESPASGTNIVDYLPLSLVRFLQQ